jgi:hypothetical protein
MNARVHLVGSSVACVATTSTLAIAWPPLLALATSPPRAASLPLY